VRVAERGYRINDDAAALAVAGLRQIQYKQYNPSLGRIESVASIEMPNGIMHLVPDVPVGTKMSSAIVVHLADDIPQKSRARTPDARGIVW
jgi:hypothetical protein